MTNILGDPIIPLLSDTPLMITKNIDTRIDILYLIFITNDGSDLINGVIVEFYGFADISDIEKENHIVSAPEYILIKIIHDTGHTIHLSDLPPSIVSIKKTKFTHDHLKGIYIKFEQFPVVLAYVIIDYKYQDQTYRWIIIDLRKPTDPGRSTSSSPYVQLSRDIALYRLSIIHPFIEAELREPLSSDLQAEL